MIQKFLNIDPQKIKDKALKKQISQLQADIEDYRKDDLDDADIEEIAGQNIQDLIDLYEEDDKDKESKKSEPAAIPKEKDASHKEKLAICEAKLAELERERLELERAELERKAIRRSGIEEEEAKKLPKYELKQKAGIKSEDKDEIAEKNLTAIIHKYSPLARKLDEDIASADDKIKKEFTDFRQKLVNDTLDDVRGIVVKKIQEMQGKLKQKKEALLKKS